MMDIDITVEPGPGGTDKNVHFKNNTNSVAEIYI